MYSGYFFQVINKLRKDNRKMNSLNGDKWDKIFCLSDIISITAELIEFSISGKLSLRLGNVLFSNSSLQMIFKLFFSPFTLPMNIELEAQPLVG